MGESMVDEILFLERGYRLRDHATCRAICLLLASLRIATNGDDERQTSTIVCYYVSQTVLPFSIQHVSPYGTPPHI